MRPRLPPAPAGSLRRLLLAALGGWTWEVEGWRQTSHRPQLPEGPPVPSEHWCTIAAGGGAGAGRLQHGLGGNTIKDKRREGRGDID